MTEYAQILKFLDESKELDSEKLLSILILVSNRLEINTVSEMARIEGKTPKGIRDSKRYRKIKIGRAKLVIKGLSETNLPF